MAEQVRLTFLFTLGQQVRWSCDEGLWLVVDRHYHEGTVSRYITYGLVKPGHGQVTTAVAYEPDVEAIDDKP